MQTKETQNQAAQLRRTCGDKLRAIKDEATPSNKVEAMATLKLSRPTLDKYINGNVPKLDTGIALLRFLRAKIEEANKRMEQQ